MADVGVGMLIDGSTGWIVGWTLVHSLWQGALVAAGLALVLRFVPGAMTRLRTTAAWGALALVISLAAATWVLVDTEWRGHAACWESEVFARDNTTLCASHAVPIARQLLEGGTTAHVAAPMPLSWIRRIALPIPRSIRSVSLAVTGGMALLALVSAGLALAALFRLALGIALLRGIIRRAGLLRDDQCEDAMRRLVSELGIRRRVELRESTEISTPGVAGWRRAIILVPSGMTDVLRPEQFADVIAHELVHVRERHFAVNIGQRMLDCLWVFNPFVRWISGRIREEREVHCDRIAAGMPAPGRRRYAEMLLQLEHLRRPASPALIGLLGEGSLLRRIRRLTDTCSGSDPRVCVRAAIAGAVALATVVAVVHVSMTTVALTSWSIMSHDIAQRIAHVESAPVTSAGEPARAR